MLLLLAVHPELLLPIFWRQPLQAPAGQQATAVSSPSYLLLQKCFLFSVQLDVCICSRWKFVYFTKSELVVYIRRSIPVYFSYSLCPKKAAQLCLDMEVSDWDGGSTCLVIDASVCRKIWAAFFWDRGSTCFLLIPFLTGIFCSFWMFVHTSIGNWCTSFLFWLYLDDGQAFLCTWWSVSIEFLVSLINYVLCTLL
jgi:hypothetical protein